MAVASLVHQGKVLRFRTNPNSIKWNYTINTKTWETYAGRVVQILSVRIEDLTVVAEAGNGGWPYMMQVVEFFRDMLVDQRKSEPGVFEYPGRGYKMKVYATAMPFRDSWDAVARSFTMTFRVQADINAVASSSTIRSELARLQDGIGFQTNPYNYNEVPEVEIEPEDSIWTGDQSDLMSDIIHGRGDDAPSGDWTDMLRPPGN